MASFSTRGSSRTTPLIVPANPYALGQDVRLFFHRIESELSGTYRVTARNKDNSSESRLRFKGVERNGIANGLGLTSIFGFKLSARRCARPGTTPCRKDSKLFATPTRPAALSVCPKTDFAAPTRRGRSEVCDDAKTLFIACISSKSPRIVPVP